MKESTVKEYKGYTPIIQYSEEDGCFIGEVAGLNLHDISFEGENEEEIRMDFEAAIDFYLANTKRPEQPFSGRITLQVTPEVHEELFRKAKSAGADNFDAWLAQEVKSSILQHA
jgi:predicted HicB family RNase H-like nuclease